MVQTVSIFKIHMCVCVTALLYSKLLCLALLISELQQTDSNFYIYQECMRGIVPFFCLIHDWPDPLFETAFFDIKIVQLSIAGKW